MYPVVRMAKELLVHARTESLPVRGTHVSRHICWPWDLDFWMELNNGRTLTLFDLGRLPLARRIGLSKALKDNGWGITVAGTSVRYRSRIRLFDRIEMRSRGVGHDDRFLYVSNWFGNSVHQYDITDPFNPVLTAQVPIPWAQMLRLSHDGKRLYVSNSLLSTWDDDEFPPGIIRNTGYGMWKIDIADPVNGGMAIDPNFFVDFDHVQKQNTIGPARPHQAFLDPGIAIGFGDH